MVMRNSCVALLATVGMACGSSSTDSSEPTNLPSNVPRSLQVVLADKSVEVDLGQLPSSSGSVALPSVIDAVTLAYPQDAYLYELVAADGYRPSYRGCPLLERSGLDTWQVYASTRDVHRTTYAGKQCYAIRDLAEIRLYLKETDGGVSEGGSE